MTINNAIQIPSQKRGIDRQHTYIHNEEIQPTPVVCKVFLKAISSPLQEHFQDEDVCENLVGILKNNFDHFSLFYVNVFKCLSENKIKPSQKRMYLC